ncbi:TetR/AcrR family transcriptional regulator [Actinomycetospora straminea]|uniref:HTH tetR-type domain-containing protein n=1 Tax=Actinomycetospora straminea TaxID=663607 RepID=A0ABP9DX17_9PSEU|nr:TetR/AcrR family transcriptional regulator [Actinomycetospora straminea]MDD7934129.1 TetR/AcrR family transcriptional regulator [Actinomycetospora straminea]
MPDAVPDPLWAPPVPSTARRPLTRAAIVDAAVALADAEGLEAVSMPRLARTLGAAPMSLYRHVPHKDALVDLMLDAAIGPAPEGAATGTWRDRLAAWARANRAVFVDHPWTLPLVSGARRMGPAECAWAEAALRAGVDAGLSVTEALGVLHVVNSYVRGASAPLGDRAPRPVDLRRRAEDFPLLVGLLETPPEEAPAEDPFETGLARVLDGVGAELDGRTTTTA